MAASQRYGADAGDKIAYMRGMIPTPNIGSAVQILQLAVPAVIALVVLFQLYAVLGRKVGRGAEQPPVPAAVGGASAAGSQALLDAATGSGLAAVKARDPSFDVAAFLQGAKSAYQTIVTAFVAGDKAALKPLLEPTVMEAFEAAIDARVAQGRTESVDFLQTPRADVEDVSLTGDLARASVRFLAELRNRCKGPEGESVDDRRTAEVWTFERNLKSRNPNWTLIHVDAAEA